MTFPQMMGDECAKPGIAVCQRMLSPFSTSQWTGVGALASTPLASRPRNCGQSPAVAQPAQRAARKTAVVRVLLTDVRKHQNSVAVKHAKAITRRGANLVLSRPSAEAGANSSIGLTGLTEFDQA